MCNNRVLLNLLKIIKTFQVRPEKLKKIEKFWKRITLLVFYKFSAIKTSN